MRAILFVQNHSNQKFKTIKIELKFKSWDARTKEQKKKKKKKKTYLLIES